MASPRTSRSCPRRMMVAIAAISIRAKACLNKVHGYREAAQAGRARTTQDNTFTRHDLALFRPKDLVQHPHSEWRLFLYAVAASWCATAAAESRFALHRQKRNCHARLNTLPARRPRRIQRLAEALLMRLRVGADPSDASRAEALVEQALKLAPKDARAWTLKAWTDINAHRFGRPSLRREGARPRTARSR